MDEESLTMLDHTYIASYYTEEMKNYLHSSMETG